MDAISPVERKTECGECASVELWRPIHYLGSKLRFVEKLSGLIDEVDPGASPVCDLFAGCGSVSAALASTRTVTAVDIQEYSRVLCSATLKPAQISERDAARLISRVSDSEFYKNLLWAASPLVEHEEKCLSNAKLGRFSKLCDIIADGSILLYQIGQERRKGALLSAMKETVQRLATIDCSEGSRAVVLRHFGGIYFSYRQSVQIASILEVAAQHHGSMKDCLFATAMSVASEVVNTVGKQFAQPIQPRDRNGNVKPHIVKQMLRDREANAFSAFANWLDRYRAIAPSNRTHQAIRIDYANALENHCEGIGVVYADPPYTRDHYSRFYHVLETMSLRDDPAVSSQFVNGTGVGRGIYRADRKQSEFCIKSQAPYALKKLFEGVRKLDVPLVLSYSPLSSTAKPRPRVMEVEQINVMAQAFFKRVEIVPLGGFAHNKLNSAEHNSGSSQDAELAFVCS